MGSQNEQFDSCMLFFGQHGVELWNRFHIMACLFSGSNLGLQSFDNNCGNLDAY